MKLLLSNECSASGDVTECGTFFVKSDTIDVTDPCYDTKVWCRGKIENVLSGTWKGSWIGSIDDLDKKHHDEYVKERMDLLHDKK